jgi:hypothetical protein
MVATSTQAPFTILHSSTVKPGIRPVIVLLGELMLVTVPPPDMTDQVPIPTLGAVAARVGVEVTQTVWLGPALAIPGGSKVTMLMVGLLDTQIPFVVVHCKTVVPVVSPVIALLPDVGMVIVPLPDKMVQEPVPTEGLFPVNAAKGEVTQTL